jgi:hypothetical protein
VDDLALNSRAAHRRVKADSDHNDENDQPPHSEPQPSSPAKEEGSRSHGGHSTADTPEP